MRLLNNIFAAGLFVFCLHPSAHALSKNAGKRTVTLDLASDGWVSTGITLDGKKKVKVKATGSGNYCNGGPKCNSTPDGSLSGEAHCQNGSNAAKPTCCMELACFTY